MSFSQGLVKIKENEESRAKSTPIAMVAPELKQNTDDTEITKTCAVLGCDESKNINSELFFRFPEDANLRQIWTDLTGRNNWTPTDYSYICVQHFSVDCFECNADNTVVLNSKAVPSLKLPKHVLEVEYIDEETLDNEYEDEDYLMDSDEYSDAENYQRELTDPTSLNVSNHVTSKKDEDSLELLKLFTEVQKMQRQAVSLKEKLKSRMKVYKRQTRYLLRVKEIIEMKRNILNQKRKKKSRILLSLQDKIREDTNGLVLAMPTRQTDDLKNFALSIYKYSPQAYIYIRNTLRTLLPSTEVLESWVSSGYEPKNVLSNSNLLKVVSELTDTELSCKVSLR
ncbi:THAP domain-containing protein 1-like [Melitaea cinxia]|uniref:THAP domain-containing protein 1-like n=1 Tax=Melitaea cinxia TaxID=113334 RepID=UPI001E26F282|nr:THAP domain-containing protein 1-like [Melitaea cinxia]